MEDWAVFHKKHLIKLNKAQVIHLKWGKSMSAPSFNQRRTGFRPPVIK